MLLQAAGCRCCATVTGYNCASPPEDCGTTEGSACCPTSSATNPPNPAANTSTKCGQNMYCQTKPSGQSNTTRPELAWNSFPGDNGPAVCVANAPDCGIPGKPCCVGPADEHVCFPRDGKKGFCATGGGLRDFEAGKAGCCRATCCAMNVLKLQRKKHLPPPLGMPAGELNLFAQPVPH